MNASLRKNMTKVLATVVLVGGAAGVAGLGTFGAFTSTTSASASVTAGRVVIDLGSQSGRGLDIAATDVLPGDTIQRAVVLTRGAGSDRFGSVRLTTAATTANLLSTDTTNGLQLKVDACSVAWTQVGQTNQLACTGTSSALLAQRPVVGTALDLAGATTALNSGAAAANLRLELSLPGTADNGFQGLSNSVGFTFDATQRSGDFK